MDRCWRRATENMLLLGSSDARDWRLNLGCRAPARAGVPRNPYAVSGDHASPIGLCSQIEKAGAASLFSASRQERSAPLVEQHGDDPGPDMEGAMFARSERIPNF